MRRKTVSELIRESKPDWKPVAEVHPRGEVRPYTGPFQVHLVDPATFKEQVTRQQREAEGLDPGITLWDEAPLVITADEPEEEDFPGSSVPRG